MKRSWLTIVLVVALLVAVILLLIRAHLLVIDFAITVPADFDVILLVITTSVASFAAIGLVFRKGMERLRLQSVEQARKEAFAEHRRFLSRLDHELKNPLMALRAGLVNLRETLQNEEEQQIILGMEIQTLRLSRLITDLRKLAELETLPLELSPIDIRELLEEVWTLVQERPEAQERRLVSDIVRISGKLIGDHDLLLLALLNLLDNALKFTQPTNTIILKACIEAEMVMIEIVDTGFGIPQEEVMLVWEELYRGTGANGIDGNGIGLALVQAIVQRHGGLTALSSRAGQGTRVTLHFPLA